MPCRSSQEPFAMIKEEILTMTQTQVAPEIIIIGVYKIIPTEKSIIEAANYHDYEWLLDEEGNYTEEIDWNNHENLGLVELQFIGDIHTANVLNSISQDDQVPYMEFWIDTDGNSLISETSSTEGLRACFFLHFIDHTKPLKVLGKDLKLPAWATLPKRLTPFTHYLPVD
jgi:hypothetical protein